MTTVQPQSTYVLFITNLPETPETKRLVWMKKIIKEGLGPKISIKDSRVFSVLFDYSAILIVGSDSLEDIEESVKTAKDYFTIKIEQCSNYHRNKEIHNFNYCVLFLGNSNKENRFNNFVVDNKNSKIHTNLDLESITTNYSNILFIDTDAYFDVHSQLSDVISEGRFIIRNVYSFSDYISLRTSPILNEITKEDKNSSIPKKQNSQKIKGIVHNNSAETAYIASFENSQTNINEILAGRIKAESVSNMPVNPAVYFWTAMSGNFTMNILWGETSPKPIKYNIPTNAPLPFITQTVASGNILSYNLQSSVDRIHLNSDVGTWLHDIIMSNKYDEKWPEDSYTGQELDCYNYILSDLKKRGINTVPKQGTLAPDKIEQVAYPKDKNLNEKTFLEVRNHLQDECSFFFNESNVWFAGNGLFHSLLMETSSVSQNDLTAVAALLNIPPKTSLINIILDSIIGDLTYFIGAIPVAGPLLAAVVNLGWTTAKLAMKPGDSSQSKQVAVADMADELNVYLANMLSAISGQLAIVNGNWGKLREFSLGVINQKITPSMFGMERVANNHQVPKEYIDAIIKSWRVICYKRLLPTFYKVSSHMNTMTVIPEPIFNATKGKYDYSYYLKCQWMDSSNNLQIGFVQMYYSVKAPVEVLKDLFDLDKLGINPIEFYMGYNGWQGGIPDYPVGEILHQPIRKVYL
ncbi:hypothetical protein [Psychroserpens luteus]|uniref:Uncharacterized protein n=1 Tax=Psychroserpens luteus TaxID=1434066 RepID=A0ABW5ZTS7_9FLAO|nr:hypothetical protein [Psychroserpens luteus]